jgi:hypothetical protein
VKFTNYAGKLFDEMPERDVCNLFAKIIVVKLWKFHEHFEGNYPGIGNSQILIVE